MNYQEAIEKLKQNHPELATVEFDISDGQLGYIFKSTIIELKILELQKEVNQMLGQKVYRAEYSCFTEVYATSEEEARNFAKRGVKSQFVQTGIFCIHNQPLINY